MKNIVILGAGLGGLTAGAMLAKMGHKVTLLEQHNIVGGSATTFKRRGGFTVEVGLHEMDDPFDETKQEIFDFLDVYEHVEFVQAKELFKVKTSKGTFVMPEGIDAAKKALKAYFDDAKGIDAYFTLISDIAHDYVCLQSITWWQKLLFPFAFRSLFKNRNKSLKEVLDTLMDNEELKLVLSTNIKYYHDSTKDFSILYHALAQYSYYNGGGWYIKGGSQKLSNHLASVITDHGGEIITKAYVNKIEHTAKKVTGISYKKKGEIYRLKADVVVSNASPMQTYEMADVDYENNKTLGISLYTLYLGFSKNIKTVYGAGAYSTFDFSKLDSLDAYENSLSQPIEKRTKVFVDYSQVDSGLTDEEKSLGVICGGDDIKDWQGLDDEAYKTKKEAVTKALIADLEKDYPGISELIEYAELATAKTVKRYLQTPAGTAYGFAPTASQFFRPPESTSDKLDNLFFVGAWVIGGGFTPAIMSGAMVARLFKP